MIRVLASRGSLTPSNPAWASSCAENQVWYSTKQNTAVGLHLAVSVTTASFFAFLSANIPPAIGHLVRTCSKKHHRTYLAKKL